MKNKKIIIVSVLIVICFLIFFLLGGIKKNKNENNVSSAETVNNVIENSFYSNSIDYYELEKIMNTDIVTNFMVYGEDSFLRLKPSERIISSYNLSNYINIQSELAQAVEKTYTENTSYTSENTSDGNVNYKIKPWYFMLYSNDLSRMIEKIFIASNLNGDPAIIGKDKHEACFYEAKILSMKIMNDHLSDYNNKDEEFDFTFRFNNGKPEKNEYFSLYMLLIGASSKYLDGTPEELNKKLDNYIDEAIKNGVINKDHPLTCNI